MLEVEVEELFRLMKTTLEVSPVFHWTEPRIKGHFVICFLVNNMECFEPQFRRI